MRMRVRLDTGAYMPKRAHELDAGYDLRCPDFIRPGMLAGYVIHPKDCVRIDTGVHIALPPGTVGFIKSRSSLYLQGLQCEGVIDAGYTGSINVIMHNIGDRDVRLEAGEKIAQLVIVSIMRPELIKVETLENTERGDHGFGSTGKY